MTGNSPAYSETAARLTTLLPEDALVSSKAVSYHSC